MEPATLKTLEERPAEAERRLAALELGGAPNKPTATSNGSLDVDRYVGELTALREVLVAAKVEQQALEKRCSDLEALNSKLAYQATHLKRALVEADEKLAGATSR